MALNSSTHDGMASNAKYRKHRMYSRLQLGANVDASGNFVVHVVSQSRAAISAAMFTTDVGLEGGVLQPPALHIAVLQF